MLQTTLTESRAPSTPPIHLCCCPLFLSSGEAKARAPNQQQRCICCTHGSHQWELSQKCGQEIPTPTTPPSSVSSPGQRSLPPPPPLSRLFLKTTRDFIQVGYSQYNPCTVHYSSNSIQWDLSDLTQCETDLKYFIISRAFVSRTSVLQSEIRGTLRAESYGVSVWLRSPSGTWGHDQWGRWGVLMESWHH